MKEMTAHVYTVELTTADHERGGFAFFPPVVQLIFRLETISRLGLNIRANAMQQISEGVDVPRIKTTMVSGLGQNPPKSANSRTPVAREFLHMVRSMRNELDTSPEPPVANEVSESASPIASGFLAMLQAASSPTNTADVTAPRRLGISSRDDECHELRDSVNAMDVPCVEMDSTATDEAEAMRIPGKFFVRCLRRRLVSLSLLVYNFLIECPMQLSSPI